MFNFSTTVPQLDIENRNLFQASDFLERCGNDPGMSVEGFCAELSEHGISEEQQQPILMAAIAIETMMSFQLDEDAEPTVH